MDLKAFSQEVHLYMQKQKGGEQSACVSSAHPADTCMALASSFLFFFSLPFYKNKCPGSDTKKKIIVSSGNFCYGFVFLLLQKPIEM